MIVPSTSFLAFAAVAALLFNLGSAVWWRQAVLLLTNLAFLASFTHDPLAFVPLAGFVGLGFLAQRATWDGARVHLFQALLAVLLLTFFWLKRYSFLPSGSFSLSPTC